MRHDREMRHDRDPNLVAAEHEIAEVFRRRDIGGFVALLSPSAGEFSLYLEPSWSGMSFRAGTVRLKLSSRDFRTQGQAMETLEKTVWLAMGLRDVLGLNHQNMARIADSLCAQLKAQGIELEHQALKDLEYHGKDTH